MTNLEQAIRDAVEKGGYKPFPKTEHTAEHLIHDFEYQIFLLDPDFWRALGKARGWKNYQYDDEEMGRQEVEVGGWKYRQHRFVDHRASGGSVEGFFQELN